MNPTSVPTQPDPTRTGAVWVTGTGAFLLLAAAAVFTAVRWDQIPDAAKLGALGLATGVFLIAGRSLKPTLPATAGALFHLGAFLVPIDVAAIGIRAELAWPSMLFVQGLVASVTFGWAAHTERSVVLRWAFAAGVIVLAGGVGATTIAPAGLVLAALAASALLLRRHALATLWAGVAGASPLIALLDQTSYAGAGTLEHLGLTGEQPRAAAVAVGILAATVLVVVGRRRDDAAQVLIGIAVGSVGVAASWSNASPEAGASLVGLGAVFLAIELTAFATRRDSFWQHPTRIVAGTAEALASLGTVAAVVPIVFAEFIDDTDPALAIATLTLAAGWLVADQRRSPRGAVSTAVAGATALAASVALATANDPLLAAALISIAVAAVLLDHRGSTLVAVAASIGAPLVCAHHPVAIVAAGIAGSFVIADAAVGRSFRPMVDPSGTNAAEQRAWILAAVSVVPGAMAVMATLSSGGHDVAALVGGAALATGLAAFIDRGKVTGTLPLGTHPRIGAVAVLAATIDLDPVQAGLVAAAVAALSLGDAIRLRSPHIALGASVAIPVGVASFALAADLSVPRAGVALALAAAVLAGAGSLLGARWALPVTATVGLSALGGLLLASGDSAAFADAVMVTGGIGLTVSVERGRLDGVALAGLAITGGVWIRLADAAVVASEPYLLPVALLLLGAGLRSRSIGTSSWLAYGPVIALFGGAALAERVDGGAGWHALVAGAVAIAAVAAGGHRRLAAPLFLGTGLLIALVAYETLAITAALPTWTWLAVGGAALLGAGVAMERHDLGPLETGRRLVDVVDEAFD